jgi:hypothetical protein
MKHSLAIAFLLVGLTACGDDTTTADTTPPDDAATAATPANDATATPADEAEGAPSDPAQACHDESPSEGSCKDCCDCQATLSCEARVSCRDTCITLGQDHFDERADLAPYEPASELGKDGDYSACLAVADDKACKQCCECDAGLLCGDFRHCRDACGDHSF